MGLGFVTVSCRVARALRVYKFKNLFVFTWPCRGLAGVTPPRQQERQLGLGLGLGIGNCGFEFGDRNGVLLFNVHCHNSACCARDF